MRRFIILIIFLVIFLLFPIQTKAEDIDKFITVVNPVRVSSYSKLPAESLKNEYLEIKSRNIPATWLLTYDTMSNSEMTSVLKSMDKSQEFGLFLEVTPAYAKDSGVSYHNTGSWHHATSVFLSGYAQEERIKLIDNIFFKFKNTFGYYPKSVGSWWTDSFSLTYMYDKYGVIANLTCSDQIATDGYQIWGQPWAMPYYPSKLYTAIPASSVESKLDVVNIQWAPRDPLNGYGSSLYSTQDYMVAVKSQKIDYFKNLVDLYTSYGQITVGLESDLDPTQYKFEYAKQMDVVNEMRQKNVLTATMSDYAKWYKQKYSGISPAVLIKSNDLLGSPIESFWYSGPKYRLFYTQEKGKITLNDLRVYGPELQEPYYTSPNNSFNLSINTPFILSVAENPNDAWVLPEGTKITPSEESIRIKGPHIVVPDNLKRSKLITINRKSDETVINFPEQNISGDGLVYKDYSVEAIHFFKQKKFLFSLLTGKGWNYLKKVDYLIPQGEVYALYYLRSLPKGRVLVYDNECLQCSYHTKLPPPVFSNRKGYVKDLSLNPIIFNKTIFEAKDRTIAKRDLKRLATRYIYLAKFEGHEEKLPFSPGDLGVTKIFSNANAEIWEMQ